MENIIEVVVRTIDEASAGLAAIEGQLARTSAAMSGIAIQAGIMGAAMVGAFGAIAQTSANYETDMGRVAAKTQIAVGTLSDLRVAAEENFVSWDSLQRGVQMFERSLVLGQNATTAQSRLFKALGVDMEQVRSGHVSMTDAFMKVADAVKNQSTEFGKAEIAVTAFGRSGIQMLPMLEQGSAGLKQYQEIAQVFGIELSTHQVQAAHAFTNAQNEAKLGMQGVRQYISDEMMPGLTSFFQTIARAEVGTRLWAQAHPEVVAQIRNVLVILLGTGGLLLALAAVAAGIRLVIGTSQTFIGLASAIISTIRAIGVAITSTWLPPLLTVLAAMLAIEAVRSGAAKAAVGNITGQADINQTRARDAMAEYNALVVHAQQTGGPIPMPPGITPTSTSPSQLMFSQLQKDLAGIGDALGNVISPIVKGITDSVNKAIANLPQLPKMPEIGAGAGEPTPDITKAGAGAVTFSERLAAAKEYAAFTKMSYVDEINLLREVDLQYAKTDKDKAEFTRTIMEIEKAYYDQQDKELIKAYEQDAKTTKERTALNLASWKTMYDQGRMGADQYIGLLDNLATSGILDEKQMQAAADETWRVRQNVYQKDSDLAKRDYDAHRISADQYKQVLDAQLAQVGDNAAKIAEIKQEMTRVDQTELDRQAANAAKLYNEERITGNQYIALLQDLANAKAATAQQINGWEATITTTMQAELRKREELMRLEEELSKKRVENERLTSELTNTYFSSTLGDYAALIAADREYQQVAQQNLNVLGFGTGGPAAVGAGFSSSLAQIKQWGDQSKIVFDATNKVLKDMLGDPFRQMVKQAAADVTDFFLKFVSGSASIGDLISSLASTAIKAWANVFESVLSKSQSLSQAVQEQFHGWAMAGVAAGLILLQMYSQKKKAAEQARQQAAAAAQKLNDTIAPLLIAGFRIQEMTQAWADSMTKTLTDLQNVLKTALTDAFKPDTFVNALVSWTSFVGQLRQNLFNAIQTGIIEALVHTAVYQAALAPIMQLIHDAVDSATRTGIFDPAAFSAQLQPLIATFNAVIGNLQPLFGTAFSALTAAFSGLGGQLITTPATTVGGASVVTVQFNSTFPPSPTQATEIAKAVGPAIVQEVLRGSTGGFFGGSNR